MRVTVPGGPTILKGMVAGLVMVAATVSASAAGPFDGRWYWKCDGPDDERGLTIIADGKISVDRIDCTILQMDKVGGEGQVWTTRNACIEGEERWFEDVIFGLERDVDGNVLQLVEIGMNDGYVLSYRRCD